MPADIFSELSDETISQYTILRRLPDGRIAGVHRLLMHWTMHVGVSDTGYEERYCYQTLELAAGAIGGWDGVSDPGGWHKHLPSGIRQHLPTGTKWHEREITPNAVLDYEIRLKQETLAREQSSRQDAPEPSAPDQSAPGQSTPGAGQRD